MMSPAVFLFTVFIICLLLSIPVGFSMIIACVLTILFTDIELSMNLVTQVLITANDSFPLMAIPFFIYAGDIMGKGGISERLFKVANTFVGHYTGGFGIAAVLTAMFFAAISGSGPATVAAIGSIMIPEMVKRGYHKDFATALVAAAGTIGIIIPPSIPMVIYGVAANVSIGDLFLSGIIPGVLMGTALMIWAYLYARKHKFTRSEKYPWKERFKALKEGFLALLMPVIILGGIYGGIFTPTEAAVVAVVYGFILAKFVYKELSWKDFFAVTQKSALQAGSIMVIVAAAAIFGRILTLEQVPATIATAITSLSDNPLVFLLLVNILLLIIGTFMETIASVTILTPILFPIAMSMGIDPVHFGLVMIVNLSLGFITPPLGVNLFVASSISNLKLEPIIKKVVPGFLVLIVVLIIITYVPDLSLAFIR